MSKQLKENTTVGNSKLEEIPATKTKKKNTITFVLVFLLIASFVGNLYLYQLNNKTNTSLADLSVQNLALQENVKSLEATNATLEADHTALNEEVDNLIEQLSLLDVNNVVPEGELGVVKDPETPASSTSRIPSQNLQDMEDSCVEPDGGYGGNGWW